MSTKNVIEIDISVEAKGAEKTLDKLAGGLKNVGDSAEKASKNVDKVEGAASKAGKTTNTFNESVNKLAKGMGLGGAAGDAGDLAEGIGGLGAGTLAAGASVGLLVVGVYKLATAFVDTMARAEELAPKLEALAGKEIISASSIAASNAAGDSLEALSLISSGIAGVLVNTYAPAIATAMDATVGLGVEAVDAYSSFGEFAGTITGPVVEALIDLNLKINPIAIGLKEMADKGKEARESLEELSLTDGDRFEASKKYYFERQAFIKSEQDKVVAAEKEKADAAKRSADKRKTADKKVSDAGVASSKEVTISLDDQYEAVDSVAELVDGKLLLAMSAVETQNSATSASMYALQSSIAAVNSEIKKTEESKNKMDWGDFAEKASKALSAVSDGIDSVMGAFGQLWALQDDRRDAEIAQIKKDKKSKQKALDNALKDFEENGKAMTGSERVAATERIKIARDELKTKDDALKAANAAKKKAMMTEFRISQGAAIAQAIISGALSAMAMIPGIATMMGPAAAGAPAVAAGIAAVATGLNVATISAEKPPQMHTGGVVDEVQRTLLLGEGVANRTAMGNPDFRQTMQAANMGQSGPRGRGDDGAQNVYFNDRLMMKLNRRSARVMSTKKRQGVANHYSGRRAGM